MLILRCYQTHTHIDGLILKRSVFYLPEMCQGFDADLISDSYWKIASDQNHRDDVVLRPAIRLCFFYQQIHYLIPAHLLNQFKVCLVCFERTKQYMHDSQYNSCMLYYPKCVANNFFPGGLPAGQEIFGRVFSNST